ncbi:hypothetical protein J5N97_028966 [Dioscorea zingiberensis]|uniref:Protein kinase domain-containing protein n=1 Tax=Dioscorea zingiberensis TaxID=325984 RepID=A0A9D5H596_9LILI|nr:hypothetical protein J5N97_028966 [Dioscorea zingiberensis]
MLCFPCLSPHRRERHDGRKRNPCGKSSGTRLVDPLEKEIKSSWVGGEKRSDAHSFSLKELAAATENFNQSNLIGKGGFGKEVAIKQLNREGMQGNEEFLMEVLMLIVLRHPNLVTLIGYCAEKEERLLVYEYMAKGSLENHLFGELHCLGTKLVCFFVDTVLLDIFIAIEISIF